MKLKIGISSIGTNFLMRGKQKERAKMKLRVGNVMKRNENETRISFIDGNSSYLLYLRTFQINILSTDNLANDNITYKF